MAERGMGRGLAAMTSSQRDIRSLDAVAPGHPSQFTGHLVAGLRGKAQASDGYLLIDDLYRYVHDRMRAEGAVWPTYRNELVGMVALGRTPSVRQTAPAPDQAADDLRARMKKRGKP